MKYLNIYITIVLAIKIIFIVLAVYRLYLKYKKPQDTKLLATIEYWKSRCEFVFITLMSLFIMYLFYPRANNINMITNESKILLFMFGFVLLLTERWSDFIHESIWFKNFQGVLR